MTGCNLCTVKECEYLLRGEDIIIELPVSTELRV